MTEVPAGKHPSTQQSPDDIGDKIVVSFHEQFAQNQNHHQRLFLQVLAVMLSVLASFGYLYTNVGWKPIVLLSAPRPIRIEVLYYSLVLAMALLSMAVQLICNMALGFRRDQLLAANIRVMSNVMNPSNNDSYFFGTFNPQGKGGSLLWMPEFHAIFFMSLLAMKALLLLSVVFYPDYSIIRVAQDSPATVFWTCALLGLSVACDLRGLRHYRRKWLKYSDEAPERLKVPHQTEPATRKRDFLARTLRYLLGRG